VRKVWREKAVTEIKNAGAEGGPLRRRFGRAGMWGAVSASC
jgi:hypothetical protein